MSGQGYPATMYVINLQADALTGSVQHRSGDLPPDSPLNFTALAPGGTANMPITVHKTTEKHPDKFAVNLVNYEPTTVQKNVHVEGSIVLITLGDEQIAGVAAGNDGVNTAPLKLSS